MEMVRQLVSIIAVLAVLAGLVWWLRRGRFVQTGPRGVRPERRLERLERLVLTPQHSVQLVRMADRAILLGLSPSGVTVLESAEWRAAGGGETR